MSRPWHDVSRRERCNICGRPDWCSVSTDGARAICRRQGGDGAIECTDKNGATFWLHRIDSSPFRPPIWPLPLSSPQEPILADAVTLDAVYRALLYQLQLSPAHQSNLRNRGLGDNHIRQGGYRTLPLRGRSAIARRIVDQFGEDTCGRIPGLIRREESGRWYWSLAGSPGLLIPVRNIQGCIVALKIRLDDPREGGKYQTFSSKHHGGPGPGAPCHIPIFGSQGGAIRITEGELKADLTSALTGMLTLSLPGVGGWKVVLPVLKALRPKTVLIAFDADWRTNPHVAQALMQCATALAQTGYHVEVEVWESVHGKGIDDVLSAGHKPERIGTATAIDAMPKAAFKPGYEKHFLGPRELWCGIPKDLVVEKVAANG